MVAARARMVHRSGVCRRPTVASMYPPSHPSPALIRALQSNLDSSHQAHDSPCRIAAEDLDPLLRAMMLFRPSRRHDTCHCPRARPRLDSCRWASIAVPLVANLQYQERQTWTRPGLCIISTRVRSHSFRTTHLTPRAPPAHQQPSSCFPPWQSVAQRGRCRRSTPLRIASPPSREPSARIDTPVPCPVPTRQVLPRRQGVVFSE